MNIYLPFILLTLAVAVPASLAADEVDHSKHHSAASQPGDKVQPGATVKKPAPLPVSQVEPQMKAMQAMHEKMMQAKTPEEKKSVMQEHMKMMHEGMAMMKAMGPAANEKATPEMMQQKMEMMQSMMESMMDHMEACMPKQ